MVPPPPPHPTPPGITYTAAFTLAWLGYEARTGLNPTQNLADVVKIMVLMWAGGCPQGVQGEGAGGARPVADVAKIMVS